MPQSVDRQRGIHLGIVVVDVLGAAVEYGPPVTVPEMTACG
jgi:hypothetical protein